MTVTLATAAVEYAKAGWEIFPGHPATKSPLTTHGMLDASTDVDQVEAWWTQHPNALICGRVPDDVVLLDVDVRYGGDRTWLTLRDELGPLPETRVHHSGRGDGGGHVWFTASIGKFSTARLDEWARARGTGHEVTRVVDGEPRATGGWSAGIDLLHHGHRYTILPPSPHPDTGAPYTWKTSCDAPIAPLPAALAELLTAPPPADPAPPSDREATAPAANGQHPLPSEGDSIADWYSSTHTVDELLEQHGWSRVGRNGRDGQRWKHPLATNAHSATVRHGCLFVYTPTPGLPVTEQGDPHGLTPFRLYALLEHGGDLSAAGAAARVLKDGPSSARQPDISWAGNGTTSTPSVGNVAPAAPWPDPAPLIDVHAPPFPLDMLPAWIGDHCEVVADRLQVPPDLCAQLALGALATVAMGHVRIHVTSSWAEPANLYLATVMPSGAGKSPADRYMVAPLRRLETQLLEQSQNDRARAAHDKEIAAKRARKLMDKAAGADDAERAEMDAWAAQQRVDAIEEQPEPRLLASDVTPEMLAVLLSRHGGRMAIVSTEADLYDVVLGAYARTPNIGVYLKGWSGDEVIVDRKGGNGSAGTAIRIPEALITVSITVQPIALAALRRNTELEMKGFVPRFMHAWPEDLVGQRDHMRALDPRPLTTTAAYDHQLIDIGTHCAGWALPADIRYQPDAAHTLLAWRQHLETSLTPDGDLAHLASWIPKIVGSTARLAGLLHLADRHPLTTPLTPDTVNRAIHIGSYWLDHATVVIAQGGQDLADAERILDWIRSTHPDEISRRAIERTLRRFRGNHDVTDAALDRLDHTGWIRPLVIRTRGSARSSPLYEAHPTLLTGQATQ